VRNGFAKPNLLTDGMIDMMLTGKLPRHNKQSSGMKAKSKAQGRAIALSLI